MSLSCAAILALTACGAGDSADQTAPTVTHAGATVAGGEAGPASNTVSPKRAGGVSAADATVDGDDSATSAVTPAQASAFLSQATFGPTAYEIDRVVKMGRRAWMKEQFGVKGFQHRAYMDHAASKLISGYSLTESHFFQSFWRNALVGSDHLRERVAFALSQIFVVSFQDGAVAQYPRGVACYYDMLSENAFGNFRELLEGVARSPVMGIYLSHMQNRPETDSTTPDENFAREIMQLMTIGLHQLNQDGSKKLSGGQPIPTYTHNDVVGLAKVFTGWSWGGGKPDEKGFTGILTSSSPNRDCLPMQNYAEFHSTSEKRFLGKTVPAGGSGEDDLKIALDTLFNHPNVGPFIARQLIQRLVTSNPSPGYIARVAAAFANNGSGERGDMQAVLTAILLDAEAQPGVNAGAGKLREPILRVAHWLRAFNARSTSGTYPIWSLEDPLTGVAQNPMRSPSVFNFYRPNYTPPRTSIADAGLTAPEMQLTGETSVIGYLNFMQMAVPRGIGQNYDVKPGYGAELSLALQPEALVDRVDLLLLNGSMSRALRTQIVQAIESLRVPASQGAALEQVKANRVYLAVYLTLASPEYLVQK
ncbi:DUF1800 family protein [Pseudoduganella chitinolytica]|uniref:DUF1800 family protein n=1 Tax=Pseudoduganella chitinolytica TaxID=34070 RepID=A0ABY8BI84_9BURK|nr:DUF1800 family protein [Pseudoduganella chitinolytica]WEF35672.1 DUF1800 family protein [Pseudoduganella chitinolytica]